VEGHEEYEEYLGNTNMFAAKDFQEWKRIRDRAMEIHTGFSSGMFERDEDVLKRVKELKDME
jgi:hypothetical protein